MRFRTAPLVSLTVIGVTCYLTDASSFQNDVVWRVEQRNRFLRHDVSKESVADALLSRAVPLEEYKARLEAAGLTLGRKLEEADAEQANDDGNDIGDDYYLDADYMYSFSGWSIKYTKCQAIQRFSEEAVENGEYSALVTDDVVILRLCPRRVCSSSAQYGCHYNFAEYAIGLSEYLKIMLKYTLDKRRNLCKFCASCNYQRRLNEGEQHDGEENVEEGKEEDKNEYKEEEQNANDAQAQGDDYYSEGNKDSGGNTDDGGCGDCCTYKEQCYEMENWCDGETDDGVYMDIPDYLNYLDCVQVDGQGNYDGSRYWVRPYCDPSKEIIKMHLFSDPYCSQVTKEVNLNDFSGLYFQSSMFEDFYSGTCIDCSESNYPPYYNAGSYMCNKVHSSSAKCTNNLVYDLFDGQEQNSRTECSFIESIRWGTYDKNGAVSSKNSEYGETIQQEVTPFQKAGLVISTLTCVALGVYACYLHHAITNLLIKSLSHSTLLPPVKRRSRHGSRSGSRASNRTGSTRSKRESEADNWDQNAGAEGVMT